MDDRQSLLDQEPGVPDIEMSTDNLEMTKERD